MTTIVEDGGAKLTNKDGEEVQMQITEEVISESCCHSPYERATKQPC